MDMVYLKEKVGGKVDVDCRPVASEEGATEQACCRARAGRGTASKVLESAARIALLLLHQGRHERDLAPRRAVRRALGKGKQRVQRRRVVIGDNVDG